MAKVRYHFMQCGFSYEVYREDERYICLITNASSHWRACQIGDSALSGPFMAYIGKFMKRIHGDEVGLPENDHWVGIEEDICPEDYRDA